MSAANKSKKYINVITPITSEKNKGLVAVVKSNNNLPIDIMNEIKNFDFIMPTYIDIVGVTRIKDVCINDFILEKIFFNNEMDTCKFFINN